MQEKISINEKIELSDEKIVNTLKTIYGDIAIYFKNNIIIVYRTYDKMGMLINKNTGEQISRFDTVSCGIKADTINIVHECNNKYIDNVYINSVTCSVIVQCPMIYYENKKYRIYLKNDWIKDKKGLRTEYKRYIIVINKLNNKSIYIESTWKFKISESKIFIYEILIDIDENNITKTTPLVQEQMEKYRLNRAEMRRSGFHDKYSLPAYTYVFPRFEYHNTHNYAKSMNSIKIHYEMLIRYMIEQSMK